MIVSQELDFVSVIVKGLLKIVSTPWDLILRIVLPKSTEGFYIFLHVLVPLFLIWNMSELELFLLESLISRFNLSARFLGLTIMSWGNNAPDMFNVASAMSKGMVDLALNAAIASEIHNILLGLGLPWLVYNCSYGKTIIFTGGDIYNITIIFYCVFILAFILFLKFYRKLDKKFAVFLIIGYLVFFTVIFIFLFKTHDE